MLLLLVGSVKDKCCGTERYNGSRFYAQPFSLAKHAVHYECSGDTAVVAYGVSEFVAVAAFYVHYAVAAVHTGVACLNGKGYHGSFVVTPYEVVALLQGKYLLEAETVLDNYKIAQIFGFYLFVAAYAYGETLSALLALEHK